MDATLILQIATLLVAAAAPFVAFRHSRKLALGRNRQAWLDALRDDVAQLIALADDVTTTTRLLLKGDPDEKKAKSSRLHEQTVELQAIRHRIRLRLRAGNALHDNLIESLFGADMTSADPDIRQVWRDAVVQSTEAIIQKVWKEIETGRG
jgi:signal transduction histidine kinase